MSPKPKKERIPVYISREAHQRLKEIAKKESRTIKAVIEMWIKS